MKRVLWFLVLVTICDAGLHGSDKKISRRWIQSGFDRMSAQKVGGAVGYKIYQNQEARENEFYTRGKNRYEQEKIRVKRVLTQQEARVDYLVESFLVRYNQPYYKLNVILRAIQELGSKAKILRNNINEQKIPNKQTCIDDLETMLRNNRRYEKSIQDQIALINSNWDYLFQAINSKLERIESSPVEIYIYDDSSPRSSMNSRVDALMGSDGLVSVEALDSARPKLRNALSVHEPFDDIERNVFPLINKYYQESLEAYEKIAQRCQTSDSPKELNSTAVFGTPKRSRPIDQSIEFIVEEDEGNV